MKTVTEIKIDMSMEMFRHRETMEELEKMLHERVKEITEDENLSEEEYDEEYSKALDYYENRDQFYSMEED